jgi:hypothetical protein
VIEPIALPALVEADPVKGWQSAIVATIDGLLTGVTVRSHPGKVDISQMMAKTIVPAPGIALGWSRVRPEKYIDGRYDLTVDWSAYIVVEDAVLSGKRVDRDRIGFAVGSYLLQILADPDVALWGMTSVTMPAEKPPAQLTPLFAVADEARGTNYLAVTWTQSLIAQGPGLFGGPTPGLTKVVDDDGHAAIDADFGDEVPLAVRALWKEAP